MKFRLVWAGSAWDDYIRWQEDSKAITKRINRLIADIRRDPHGQGIGKAEILKFEGGAISRRIDGEHRLVYRVVNEDIEIAACRQHYQK